MMFALWLVAVLLCIGSGGFMKDHRNSETTKTSRTKTRDLAPRYRVLRPFPSSSYGNTSLIQITRRARAVSYVSDITSQINQHQGDGTYIYSYETSNGIQAQESGSVPGPDSGTFSFGGFTYTSPEGELIQVSYTADEKGFNPKSDHIPTPPPIPEEILKALEKNAADEVAAIFDDGSYKGDVGRPLSQVVTTQRPIPTRPPAAFPGEMQGITCMGTAASLCNG